MKDVYEWSIMIILALGMLAVGIGVGGALQSISMPTAYANGYCEALGGERLNDETCNVNGEVVVIP